MLGLSVAGAQAADPAKILRITFQAAETGFDPVKVSDYYSGTVISAIFDPLLTYDYLARPAKIVPLTAESMPEVLDGGRTYILHLKRGIYFTPDPAFKGKRRELVAEDYVYTFKRFPDPKNRSPWAFMVEGHIEGLDEAIEAGRGIAQHHLVEADRGRLALIRLQPLQEAQLDAGLRALELIRADRLRHQPVDLVVHCREQLLGVEALPRAHEQLEQARIAERRQ